MKKHPTPLRRQMLYERSRAAPGPPSHRSSFSITRREIALCDTFGFDITCSNQRIVSPRLCGSNPYPCGSLTYRISFVFTFIVCLLRSIVNPVCRVVSNCFFGSGLSTERVPLDSPLSLSDGPAQFFRKHPCFSPVSYYTDI